MFDTLTKEEIWERRRQRALRKGLNVDSDDDAAFEDNGTFDGRQNGSDSLDPGLASKRVKWARSRVSPQDGQQHPPCPEGYDPDKWAKLSLEEKLKYLGIDMNAWLKMSRE